MEVMFKNATGVTRKVKVGFSWTSFCFGGFPFFFRGLPLYGLIWVVLAVITFGFSNIYLMFVINKITAHKYLESGYKPIGEGWDIASRKWGVAVEKGNAARG